MKTVVAVIGLMLLGSAVRTNERASWSFNGENKIFLITLDGFRWQEVFSGADSALLNEASNSSNTNLSKMLYWATSKEERRKKLMPFLWNVIAQQGEICGNREKGSRMNVSNPYALSYPGYNELLTGRIDLTIFNNGKTPNQNSTLLDLLNATPTYRNKVAAFASWDAFPYILNKEKSTVFINSGFDALPGEKLDVTGTSSRNAPAEMEDPKNTRCDELTLMACKEYVQKSKPSVVFLSFGGTDEAAHQKKYEAYLQQAANADRMIGELWQWLQSLPEYNGKTTFLITTDHGRGASATNWFKHGILVNGSSQTWMALMGPSVAAQGERKNGPQVYLKSVKDRMLDLLTQPINNTERQVAYPSAEDALTGTKFSTPYKKQ